MTAADLVVDELKARGVQFIATLKGTGSIRSTWRVAGRGCA